MRHRSLLRSLALVATALLLAVSFVVVPLPSIAAETAAGTAAVPAASPAFRFTVDQSSVAEIQGKGGSLLTVRRDGTLAAGEALTLSGWVATDRGIAGYQYIWAPSGGAATAWQDVPDADIFARDDLTAAGVPYSGGHATAGYRLTLPPPADLTDGYYDVFVRAIDGDGAPCDFLALVRLRYGNTDADDGTSRHINPNRLLAEIGAADDPSAILRGGTTVSDAGITLPPGGRVRLGTLDLSSMSRW